MIARLVKKLDDQVVLLCKDGSICNSSVTVLANFLSKFKDSKNFSGNDGKWSGEYGDMALFPGQTLAYVTDDVLLVIYDFEPFEPIISKSYNISSYISLAEYAEKVDKSNEIVKVLCREGRIVGAQKIGGSWMIPEDAPYPVPPHRRRVSARRK